MRTWLRSLVNAVLGKVPGKTSRLDTAAATGVAGPGVPTPVIQCASIGQNRAGNAGERTRS
jgi:hypothetical protein